MGGQKFQTLADPILLVGFEGNQGMKPLFFEKGKEPWKIDGTLAQGQMIIQAAVIVVEVEHPQKRTQAVDPVF